jgi:PmbA protein
VVGAVTETMISGNIFEMFENIRDISKEVYEDGSCVIPSIAFDGIVISGE